MTVSTISGKIGAAASQVVTLVSDTARATAAIMWAQATKIAHVVKNLLQELGKAGVALYGQGKHAVSALCYGAKAHPTAAAAILSLTALAGAGAYVLKDRYFSV